MFDAIDENKDGQLSASELRALIIGIRFEEIDLDQDDAVSKILRDFDTSLDDHIDIEEFITGIGKWLNEATRTTNGKRTTNGSADPGPHTLKFLDDFHQVSCRTALPLLSCYY